MILRVIFYLYNFIANFGKSLLVLQDHRGISGELMKVHGPGGGWQVMDVPEALVSSGMHRHA
jgi:hypothetical protein